MGLEAELCVPFLLWGNRTNTRTVADNTRGPAMAEEDRSLSSFGSQDSALTVHLADRTDRSGLSPQRMIGSPRSHQLGKVRVSYDVLSP